MSMLASIPSSHEDGPQLCVAKLLCGAEHLMQCVARAPEDMPELHHSTSHGERAYTEENAGACMLRPLQHCVIN